MAAEPLGDVIRRLGRLDGLRADLALTDAELLDRFVARRDEAAFAALMVRHGPMVLCLCRQMLRDAQEAEDAFQAAFLVLARNAATIRKRPSLSAWLYGVAFKVAARLRGRAERRRTRERPGFDMAAIPSAGEQANADVRPVVHEEIRRLPEKYRAPVVLCYLEGKTNEEAAGCLRWPVGTVKARLFRAREMLRSRLVRREMGALPSPARHTASILPFFLLDSTLRAAMRTATAGAAAGTALAALQLAKLKVGAAAALALCVLGAGTGWYGDRPPSATAPPGTSAPAPLVEGGPRPTDVATNKVEPAPTQKKAPAAVDERRTERATADEMLAASVRSRGTPAVLRG